MQRRAGLRHVRRRAGNRRRSVVTEDIDLAIGWVGDIDISRLAVDGDPALTR